MPSHNSNVQSARLRLPFWTSSCLHSALTSNLPGFSFPFGLHRAFTQLQRPILRASASLLDFIVPSHSFNVQSSRLWLPFWTSSCLPASLTSNLPAWILNLPNSYIHLHTSPITRKLPHHSWHDSFTHLYPIQILKHRTGIEPALSAHFTLFLP